MEHFIDKFLTKYLQKPAQQVGQQAQQATKSIGSFLGNTANQVGQGIQKAGAGVVGAAGSLASDFNSRPLPNTPPAEGGAFDSRNLWDLLASQYKEKLAKGFDLEPGELKDLKYLLKKSSDFIIKQAGNAGKLVEEAEPTIEEIEGSLPL